MADPNGPDRHWYQWGAGFLVGSIALFGFRHSVWGGVLLSLAIAFGCFGAAGVDFPFGPLRWLAGLRPWPGLRLLSASYSTPRVPNDVTEVVRKLRQDDGTFDFVADNDTMEGDPEYGVDKIFTITYRRWLWKRTRSFKEYDRVRLP